MRAIPNLKEEGLRGGVIYHDGQFDDSRLAVNLAQTAVNNGAVVINYMKVIGLLKNDDQLIEGVELEDMETKERQKIYSKTVINATGVFADSILQMDDPSAEKTIVPSQGIHLVLDKDFLQGESAIMIPKTADGRVLFAVPWHNKVVLGTTDTLVKKESLEPRALESEIEFILNTAAEYLTKTPTRADVKSVFAGLRPLAATKGKSTKEISRSHKVIVSLSGMVTTIGGKWTTYRRMGEDTIDKATLIGDLPERPSVTKNLAIHGAVNSFDFDDPLYIYGTDKVFIQKLILQDPGLGAKLHPSFDYIRAEVIWAAKAEMARTVEDVLARRLRALFLDARASIEMAPQTASLLASVLGKNKEWEEDQVQEYTILAKGYILE
jgi:glycerol-3-phosphate dehydrogenase